MQEQLHRIWLERLRFEWRMVNIDQLDSRLLPPVFSIDVGPTVRLGRWERRTRTLGISEAHIWSNSWDEVLATLRHEMAHQVAHELLDAQGEEPHGPAFILACQMVGANSAATTPAHGSRDSEVDRALDKVRKLLALAASPNQHEAEVAMAAANTLLLKYNLALTGGTGQQYGYRRVGPTQAAVGLDRKLIASILSQFFFVECIWISTFNAKRGRAERQLELNGTPASLDMAAYVHDFLTHAAEGLWQQKSALAAPGYRQARREFIAGVLMGFSEKLRAERHINAGKGLIWLGDPELKRYHSERHPRTSNMAGSVLRRGSLHEAGRQAGKNLQIHRGIHEQSGASGRLLGHT